MLLDVILECHAWSSARPKHETQASARKIEEKITAVMNVEQEQGMFPQPTSPSFPFLLVGRPHSAVIFLFRRHIAVFFTPGVFES